ncbi:MAG: AGE family epimerase/isomerase, partial [Clostridia bacterium]|nr:AGE family epimerase/isomerase [Clostridia bacterium]
MEYTNEIREHLETVILPFWQNLKDDVSGGYIGYVDQNLKMDPSAVRGCILNSRILWFFSQASVTLDRPDLLPYADHAYDMLCRMCDIRNGGVFWSVRADGTVEDSTKHTYNQAFAIYALSCYSKARPCAGALEKALGLFELIEDKCTDDIGYLEAHTADWKPESNEKLSENGVMAEKTMNTLLHVLEAYTELYRVSGDSRVRERLVFILNTLAEKIYNPERHRQEVFFDRNYHSLIDLHSFGHDIETSWLADRALEILGDDNLTAKVRPMLIAMAEETYRCAFTDHGFANECECGRIDTTRIWWVQAEALLGFLNAWQKTGDVKFKAAAESQWRYIRDVMTDHRRGSEWFWSVDVAGRPIPAKPLVEPWKCPYHNGR